MAVKVATYEQLALEDPSGKWEFVNGYVRKKPPMAMEHNNLGFELATGEVRLSALPNVSIDIERLVADQVAAVWLRLRGCVNPVACRVLINM